MKIALMQFEPEFLAFDKNMDKATALLEKTSADIAVFPELFLSGYTFTDAEQVKACAVPFEEGPGLDPLLEVSKKKSLAVCGGYAEIENNELYNSSFFIADGELVANYRKVHLFNREKLYFQPGNRGFEVFKYRDAKVGMMICFDWIFPEAARSLAVQGAQAILHPANLVLPYCQQAMFARALENRVFIITVNRVGTEMNASLENTFTGGSQIVSPFGEYLIRMKTDREQVATIAIDPSVSLDKHITAHNHVIEDRRKAFYSL